MEKGSSNSKVMVLIPVLILVLAFFAYRYLVDPMVQEKKVLDDQKYELQQRKIELQNLKTREEEFKSGIEVARVQMNEALNRFAGGQSPEKSIMFANGIEMTLGPKFVSLSFNSPELVTSMNLPLIHEAENGTYSVSYSDVGLYRELLVIAFEADYGPLKQVTDFISKFDEKMNLKALDVSYEAESGRLTGTIGVNLYSVLGSDKQYVAPEITDIRIGEDNIFTH